LFPEGRDKGVDFSLQNHRLPQVQRPTLSIQAFEAEECRQNEGRAAATSQDRDRNVPKLLNEANAVADARGSVYDSCKLAAEPVQRMSFLCTQGLASFIFFSPSPYVHSGLDAFVQTPI